MLVANMHHNKPVVDSDQKIEVCRVRWRKRTKGWSTKLFECTGCGYVSERKSNVLRHFGRIHCALTKCKTCICGHLFSTKGDYYEHCVIAHPHLRNSYYVTKEKHKIGKFLCKSARNNKVTELYNQSINFNKVTRLKSSTQFISLCEKPVLKEQSVSEISISSNKPNILNNFKYKNEKHNVEDNKENYSANVDCKKNVITTPNFQCEEMKTLNEDASNFLKIDTTPVRHLPLKKRFGKLTQRKYLSDMINFNYKEFIENNYIKNCDIINENLNNNDIQVCNQNLITSNEQQRAFFSQIDFDLLDAVLNLKYLKESNH